jgi:hexosaminidase
MMKATRYALVATLMASFVPAQTQFQNNLMPLPSSLTAGIGSLALTSTFAVQTPSVHDVRLLGAIDRAARQVEVATGLPHAGPGVASTTKLVVNVQRPSDLVQSIDEDESYTLKVTTSAVEIDAPTDVGAMHGLATLVQLVQPGLGGYILPAVSIQDTPRFRWRGLMIDCGRHFQPISVLERNIDAMAAVKLNVLHWHLTEDQGFRMESKLYAKLTAKGSDGLFYTQQQAKDLVAYARDRGIRVVPEFEMPGHSAAWLFAYPELASGTVPDGIRRDFGVSNFAIDPTRDATYVFIGKFLNEMAAIFPDAYMHIGGDETPAPDWKTNPRILTFMKAHDLHDNAALQAYFNTRVLTVIAGMHKHMVGWDEVLTPSLPKDVVVQSWRGVESLSEGAKLGYQGILSAPYYLDGMKPAGVHYLADPMPPASELSPAEGKLILGAETAMWGEHIDARTIDSRIWPRTAAIAERFWSPEEIRDVDDMYRRLAVVSIELERLGLTHLQSKGAILRGLAGTTHIDALRTMASAMEPVSFHDRSRTQHTNQLTPFDRLVDAVTPDPPSRHWSELTVRYLLANPTDTEGRTALDAWFLQLSACVPEVKRQMATSPLLDEAATRADQLAILAERGHEALTFIGTHKKAPAGWKAHALAATADAEKPSALIRFTFLTPLNDLINAVQE